LGVGGDDLTGALHVLSPSLPLSLAPIKPTNPGSPGKMAENLSELYTSKMVSDSETITGDELLIEGKRVLLFHVESTCRTVLQQTYSVGYFLAVIVAAMNSIF